MAHGLVQEVPLSFATVYMFTHEKKLCGIAEVNDDLVFNRVMDGARRKARVPLAGTPKAWHARRAVIARLGKRVAVAPVKKCNSVGA
eukprot:366538-Chlamydomonas_euryale.AAC.4